MIFWKLIHVILLVNVASSTDFEENDLAKVCVPIERPLDVLFILDGSGSVSGSTFSTQVGMLHRIIEMVEIGANLTQIAVMQYASFTRLEFPFHAYKDKSKLLDAVSKLHHMSGTTKTGKALEKALQVFMMDRSTGARRDVDVAQVAVVVSDGHSHDNPVPAAIKLREAGVLLMTLGIGYHINRKELIQMTGDENLTFEDVQSQESLVNFTYQFKKIAKGEHCDYSRGPNGAETKCGADWMSIGVTTTHPFKGQLFVSDHFGDPHCVANATGKEVDLKLRLDQCDLGARFMSNPPGILYEAKVELKFHPSFSMKRDKLFTVRCFYPDKKGNVKKKFEALNQLNEGGEETIIDESTECNYNIFKQGSNCTTEQLKVGDVVEHRWSCRKDILDTYQSMLIHSCHIIDPLNQQSQLIIDERGCSVDSSVISTPNYKEPLVALSIGQTVRFPDMPLIKARCSVRLCDRLLGECENILPPRCNSRTKRSLTPPITILAQSHSEFSHEMRAPVPATVRVPSFVTYREVIRKQFTTASPLSSISTEEFFPDITMRSSEEITTNQFDASPTVPSVRLPTTVPETTSITLPTVTRGSISLSTVTLNEFSLPTISQAASSLLTVPREDPSVPTVTRDDTSVPTVIQDAPSLPTVSRHDVSDPTVFHDQSVPTVSRDDISPTVHRDDISVPTVSRKGSAPSTVNRGAISPIRSVDSLVPRGGLDVKLNAQKVAIVRSDNFKDRFREALRVRAQESQELSSEDVTTSTESIDTPPRRRRPMVHAVIQQFEDSPSDPTGLVTNEVTFEQPSSQLPTVFGAEQAATVPTTGLVTRKTIINIPLLAPGKETPRVWTHRRNGLIVAGSVRSLFNELAPVESTVTRATVPRSKRRHFNTDMDSLGEQIELEEAETLEERNNLLPEDAEPSLKSIDMSRGEELADSIYLFIYLKYTLDVRTRR